MYLLILPLPEAALYIYYTGKFKPPNVGGLYFRASLYSQWAQVIYDPLGEGEYTNGTYLS